jgi:hypothetical protein
MVCIDCGCDNSVKLQLSEVLKCEHCKHDNTMDYFICINCGAVWRQYNNDVYGSVLGCGYSEEGKCEDSDEEEFLCLYCQSVSYEISKGTFKCSNPICGFEWRVVNDD